tara:strand:- start:137 stop:373 length:237 start_codon:yes stop_codon:yes gene_type:complete
MAEIKVNIKVAERDLEKMIDFSEHSHRYPDSYILYDLENKNLPFNKSVSITISTDFYFILKDYESLNLEKQPKDERDM